MQLLEPEREKSLLRTLLRLLESCRVRMAHGGVVQGSHLVLRGSRLQEKAIKGQGEYKDWQGKGLGVPRNYLIEFSLLVSG